MEVDRFDIQGLTAFGYAKLIEAEYYLLRVRNAAEARAWIGRAAKDHVSTAECKPSHPESALQIAFTADGMRAIGLSNDIVEQFSPEFLTGMYEPNRSRRLGDIGANDPAKWRWGTEENPVHLIVMIMATKNLAAWRMTVQSATWTSAFDLVATLETSDMGGHEPFGFKDGISQPEFDWKREQALEINTTTYRNRVALGELLLGYPNEYGKYTDRPLLDPASDPQNLLAAAEEQPSMRDLGLNGTYLVARQLEQDVRGFWQYLDRTAGGVAAERYRLASAMVGRDTKGTPVVPSASPNGFDYDADPAGVKCPFGAHIHRANPRNADLFGHPAGLATLLNQLALPRPGWHDDLMASTRFHRVLRRGREYGEKISPEAALSPAASGESSRGLQFVALCANLVRQFEFVQNAWLMSTKFDGLTDESDPLLGSRSAVGDCPVTGYFSIPRDQKPAERLTDVPQFVTMRGGAYFFLPSLRALRFFAQAGNSVSPGE